MLNRQPATAAAADGGKPHKRMHNAQLTPKVEPPPAMLAQMPCTIVQQQQQQHLFYQAKICIMHPTSSKDILANGPYHMQGNPDQWPKQDEVAPPQHICGNCAAEYLVGRCALLTYWHHIWPRQQQQQQQQRQY
jgi:hypothetical protein